MLKKIGRIWSTFQWLELKEVTVLSFVRGFLERSFSLLLLSNVWEEFFWLSDSAWDVERMLFQWKDDRTTRRNQQILSKSHPCVIEQWMSFELIIISLLNCFLGRSFYINWYIWRITRSSSFNKYSSKTQTWLIQ